jgi:hypothetical protein
MEQQSVGFKLIKNIVHRNLRGELSLRNDPGAVTIIRFECIQNGVGNVEQTEKSSV